MQQQELKAAFDMLLSPDPKNTAVAIELLESPLFTASQVKAYADENFGWAMQGKWFDGDSDEWQRFTSWKQLASLLELGLQNTQIKALPHSIGQLASLQRLYLQNTQIKATNPVVVALKERGVKIYF